MDLDKSLVAAIITAGRAGLEQAQQFGIGPVRLQGEGKTAYEFVVEYLQKYNELPSSDFVLGKTGVSLDPASAPVLALIEEVNNRHLHNKIQQGLKEVIQKQEARQPGESYLVLEKLLEDLRTEQIGSVNVESVWKLGPEIRAFYDRIKSGQRGIETPWPTINDATLGFWPEDLILFVARVGMGKTWTAVQLAHYAWSTQRPGIERGTRVLFITTEVSRMRIGMRFLAYRKKLPYGDFTHGRLSTFKEFDFYKETEALYSSDGLYIIGGDFDFKLESVAAAIETCKPDLVVIDGVYLLRVQGQTRTERMANAFDEVKRLAKRKKVPIIITTQFNREVKKDIAKTVQVESIALSDVGGWNADLIFGLIQTDDMRKEKQMIFKPLKVREGEGKEITVNWDFMNMDFSELNPEGGGGGDADEKDTLTTPISDVQAKEDDVLPF